MLHVYHGDGKGKTTAAMGLALRAHAAGWPVLVVQFLKDGSSGEVRELAALGGASVRVLHDEPPVVFTFRMTPEQRVASKLVHDENLQAALASAREAASPVTAGPLLVVLDEVLDALNAGLLDEAPLRELAHLASGAQDGPEVVLTGRNPAPWLLDAADYVTQMRAERHPYERGITARAGVEY